MVVTLALIQPSGCVEHEALPRVSEEVAFFAVHDGWAVHRDDVVAAPVDHTSQGWVGHAEPV
jgi:hypothetical protein